MRSTEKLTDFFNDDSLGRDQFLAAFRQWWYSAGDLGPLEIEGQERAWQAHRQRALRRAVASANKSALLSARRHPAYLWTGQVQITFDPRDRKN